MDKTLWIGVAVSAALVAVVVLPACGDDDPPPPAENAGQSCAAPAECYPKLDGGALRGGAIQCLTRVTGGYCTHLCTADSDCCAVPGECVGNYRQVCAPFESTGQKMCFLSCEAADIAAAGATEANYCQTYAHPAFGCRSTGGGSENRKVCVP